MLDVSTKPLIGLASVNAEMGRYAEAEADLTEALACLEAALGPDHQRTVETVTRLAKLYDAWGKAKTARDKPPGDPTKTDEWRVTTSELEEIDASLARLEAQVALNPADLEQVVFAQDLDLVQLLQELARRMICFGLHVHVGVDSGDKAVMICDRMMRHLPMLLALTCSSPSWENRATGLQSHRSKILEGLPTAGLPTLMRNWSEYVWLVNHMVDTGFINTIREIWWDVRPHHNFGTAVDVTLVDKKGRESLFSPFSVFRLVHDQHRLQRKITPTLTQTKKLV